MAGDLSRERTWLETFPGETMGSMRSVVRTFSARKIRIYFAHTRRRTCRHPSANMRAPKWPRRPESTKAALERASVLCKRLRDQLKIAGKGAVVIKGEKEKVMERDKKRTRRIGHPSSSFPQTLPLFGPSQFGRRNLPSSSANDIRGTEQPIIGHQPCPL